MKVKKILNAVISAVICCSFLPANVSADEFDLPISTDSYISLMSETVNGNNSVISALPNGCQLEDFEIIPNQLNGISTYSNTNNGVSTYASANFVMGLNLSAANPESVINGSPTTDTILYWLWSNGEEQYTYDPAGNEIVQYYVFGIDDYMLETLSIGDEVVGFATQFTEAGPQEFQYYAENSNGDICGTICSITIEPADGSNRPVGNLQVSSGTYYDNTDIVFSWSNSYDVDDSDYIMGARVRVYDENNVLLTEGSEYSLSMDNQNKRFTLNFANTGIHRVYISVYDNHNNWSNWVGGSINVEESPAQIQILTLADTEWKDSKSVRTKPTGSNSYVNHTLWSRLGGDICVLKGTGGTYSTYTNHNGTYYNVAYDIIAPGTVFMSAETWVSSSNPNSYTDPYFKDDTPRGIAQEEIDILRARGKVNYIVYDPNTLQVIDFYSVLNPLVVSGWSVVTHTP